MRNGGGERRETNQRRELEIIKRTRWKRSAASGEGIIVRKWMDLVHSQDNVYAGMHVCIN